jgi:hypothetical protein
MPVVESGIGRHFARLAPATVAMRGLEMILGASPVQRADVPAKQTLLGRKANKTLQSLHRLPCDLYLAPSLPLPKLFQPRQAALAKQVILALVGRSQHPHQVHLLFRLTLRVLQLNRCQAPFRPLTFLLLVIIQSLRMYNDHILTLLPQPIRWIRTPTPLLRRTPPPRYRCTRLLTAMRCQVLRLWHWNI